MPSVIATDSTRRSSINSNISRATRGSARISPASTFQSRKLFHLCILGWHDADSDLGRLAEVRTIECNRRNRPTPQSLPGFLAQALEESVFDHIASLSEASVHDGAALHYSITSSASASSFSGTVSPSALAVLRLIANSNLVGCSTGSSAGLAPCRIRCTYQAPRLNRSGRGVP